MIFWTRDGMIFWTEHGAVCIAATEQHSWMHVSARDEAALKSLWPDRTFYYDPEKRSYSIFMARRAIWWRMARIQRIEAKVDPMYLAITPSGIEHPDGAA